MGKRTKDIVALVMWLVAGFALTEVAAFALSRGFQKPVSAPVGRADPNQTIATAPAN